MVSKIEWKYKLIHGLDRLHLGMLCEWCMGHQRLEMNHYENVLHEYYPPARSSAKITRPKAWLSQQTYDLSIIIPCFKVEGTILACLDSIFSQPCHHRIEVICIDDGSPDATGDLLDAYGHGIRVIHQENQGLSGARNTGLSVCRGRYVMFLDSDDVLAPHSLDAFISMAIDDDLDICEGSYYESHCLDHLLGTLDTHELYGFPWGKLYKRDLFESLQFPLHYIYEDTLGSVLLYPKAKKICHVNTPLYIYTINPNGLCSQTIHQPKVLDTLYIYQSLMADFDGNVTLKMYNAFLYHIAISMNRMIFVPLEIKQAAMGSFKQLRDTYFAEFKTSNPRYQRLEENLDALCFGQFELEIIRLA